MMGSQHGHNAPALAVAPHDARAQQHPVEEAITDGLTGLTIHSYFMEELEREWRRSTRARRPFSLILVDLDKFKQFNDRMGYLEGDKVLRTVAARLDARMRRPNVVARYGGDEFAILVPETNMRQAEILAETLRAAVEADDFLRAHDVTASFGIATFPDHGPSQEDILRVADCGMYLAKHNKGNCVKVALLSPEAGDEERDQPLLQAYLGVAVKRMFSTGPDTFTQYLHRFQQMMQPTAGEAPSLLDTITALAFTIEAKDPYTKGHSQAVSRLATEIARQMRLSDADIEEIGLAGILHDIGKIGVPESVLKKPTLLTADEYETMKTHPVLGAKILEPLKVKGIERIVRHHHERYDGKGYPDGLAGDKIPLGARIVAVAEAFEVMVTDLPYKSACTFEDAGGELRRCSGTQFDPQVVGAFLDRLQTDGDPRALSASLHDLI
jgi:diguanylate cyclase (GGDEF)-like protein/putative nucleotidyltransferase with HDIG domain